MIANREGLPVGWVVASLSELVEIGRGNTDPNESPDVPFNYVALENVSKGSGKLVGFRPTCGRDIGSTKSVFCEGDVLYGKLRPYLQKALVAPFDGVSVTDLISLAPRIGVNARYIHRYLLGPQHLDYITPLLAGIRMPRLRKADIERMPVPIPGSNEQRRIVAKIEALQERSDAAKQALDAIPPLLERFRQSVLAAAFRGDLTRDWREQSPDVEPASVLLERIRAERKTRIVEDAAEKARAKAEEKARKAGKDWREEDDAMVLEKERGKADARYQTPAPLELADLPSLPPTWSWATYDEVVEVQLGQRRAPEFRDEEARPYIRSANITWSGLDLSDVKVMGFADPCRLLLKPGDVLLNEASGSKTEVGKPALWNGEVSGCCFQATVLRLRAYSADLLPRWIYFHCLRDALLAEYAARCPGLGIIHLTAKLMRSWPIPVAPLEEQEELASRLTNLLDGAASQESSLATARSRVGQLEQAVLATAFRGGLVPQDPDDEPASNLLKRIREQRAQSV